MPITLLCYVLRGLQQRLERKCYELAVKNQMIVNLLNDCRNSCPQIKRLRGVEHEVVVVVVVVVVYSFISTVCQNANYIKCDNMESLKIQIRRYYRQQCYCEL